jgi:hypothetical protein
MGGSSSIYIGASFRPDAVLTPNVSKRHARNSLKVLHNSKFAR